MRTILLLLSSAAAVMAQSTPSAVDCRFTNTFTSATPGAAQINDTVGTPCVAFRVTVNTSGFSGYSIQFETSPDNSTWTAVPNTTCTVGVAPPCVIDGSNPDTTTGSSTFSVKAYGKFIRLNVTSVTGSGTISTNTLGYKGLSAQGTTPPSGGLTDPGSNGFVVRTALNTTAARSLVAGSGITITNTDGTAGNPTISTTGTTAFSGITSGTNTTATMTCGAGCAILSTSTGTITINGIRNYTVGTLPSSSTIGAIAEVTDGSTATDCTVGGASTKVLCVANGTAWTSVGSGGTSGSTLFSTTNSTTATAASATTLIGTVTGSTTVPANTFTAGSLMEFGGQGFYTSTGARTLNIQLFVGGSARIATGAVTVPGATLGTWQLRCLVTTRTTGVSGTQIANCVFLATGATLTAPAAAPMQTSSTWTIDTTSTQALDIQATWDSTTGAPTITSTNVAAWFNGSGSGGGGSSGFSFQPNTSATGAPQANLPTSGWSPVNGGVLDDFSVTSTGLFMPQNTGVQNLRAITRTIAGTYTLYALVNCSGYNSNAGTYVCGLVLSDGTKYESYGIIMNSGARGLIIQTYTTVNSGISTVINSSTDQNPSQVAFRIVNNGTNRVFSYWKNGAWVVFFTESSGTFLTENAAGVGGFAGASTTDTLSAQLLYWSVQ